MDLHLTGRKALVLGSSKGLGYAIARSLVREGASVMIVGRDEARLAEARTALLQAGPGPVATAVADLSDPGAPAHLAQAVEAELGGADILVTNGGGPPPGPVTEIDRTTWEAQFAGMVSPMIDLANRLLPGMRERGWGRVLAVVSSGVVQPIPNLGASNALRSAIVGWIKTLANEVGPDGITANCLAPGRIATDRTQQLDEAAAQREGREVSEIQARSRANMALRRYGDPEEFGDTAAFLTSPRGSYITGSVVRVDGGLIKSV